MQSAEVPQSFGGVDSDLVFVPVLSSRIVDTCIAGGPSAAGTSRDFYVTSVSNYTSQGGAATNGNAGSAGGGVCTASACDTQAYIAAVNATALCGFTNWRLPSKQELSFIIQEESREGTGSATINTGFFPNTRPAHYWTGTNFAANANLAWMGNFNRGGAVYQAKSTASHVMLVRGTP
ncbi:MAG: DUF1566 domain-containing protein [Rhodanobacteraceae bacterium]|nr:DUF1566 domain-containing protein [Rhodanobacteraceae bacterium]